MKFFAVASLLFVGTLAVPTSQCGECQKHHGHHPGGNQPGGNQPGGNQPGGNQPGGNQPGGNQPGGIQPGGNQPGGNQPGGNQPGGIQPGGNQPGNQPGGNNPGGNNPGNPGGNAPYKPCPSGLYSNPQCCATNVLGVAALDCKNPSSAPTSSDNFKSVCGGQQPLCCVVPAAGQGVLCTAPVGGGQPGGGNPGSNPGNNPGGSNPGGNPGGNNPGNNPGGNNPGGSNPGNNPGGNNPGGNPGGNNPGNDYKACPSGLYGNPQCCATNVLGVAALDCANPSSKPTSGDNFKSTCGAAGKQALCCAVPVAGLDVLCTPASGGGNPGSNPGSNPGGNPGGNQPGGNNPGSNPGGNQPGSNNPGNNPGGNNPGNNPGSSNPGGNNPGNNQGGNQPGGGNNYKACPSGLYSNPQCCATNILGVAALDCGNPSRKPTSSGDFKSTCASDGKRPVCCVVPAAGQGVLCTSASG